MIVYIVVAYDCSYLPMIAVLTHSLTHSLHCRYTQLVAKRPHMMDHLTINISGYVYVL